MPCQECQHEFDLVRIKLLFSLIISSNLLNSNFRFFEKGGSGKKIGFAYGFSSILGLFVPVCGPEVTDLLMETLLVDSMDKTENRTKLDSSGFDGGRNGVLQNPLGQQKQSESRQAQNCDDQRVQQVESQGDAGESSCQVDCPQGEKSQEGVGQQLQSDPEGRAENADQCDEKEGGQNSGDDLLSQIHTASPGKSMA